MSDPERLTLSDEPDAASRARRFVHAALDGTRYEERADDAVLVVSEMVTNALLHAEPPVSVDLVVLEEHLRIEVRDGAHRPMAAETPTTNTSTTGRGLSVVDALAIRWGVEPEGAGKVVWAELGDTLVLTEHEGEIDLDAWDDFLEEPAEEQQYTVDVGEAPTDLVLAASEQIDSQLRELTLMWVGQASGQSAAVPTDLRQTLNSLDQTFAELRRELKRLAAEAAAAGLERTRIKLTLSEEAVTKAQSYLYALDAIDEHARAGDMLTLETPRRQRQFHRWYIETAVAQVSALRRHDTPPPVSAFEDAELA